MTKCLTLRNATDHARAHGLAGLRRNIGIRGLPIGDAGSGKYAERDASDDHGIVVGAGRQAQGQREDDESQCTAGEIMPLIV